MPHCPAATRRAKRFEEGVRNIREAIELYLESLTEDGLPNPIEPQGPSDLPLLTHG